MRRTERRDDRMPAKGSVLHFVQDCEIYSEGDDAESFFKVVGGVVRTCKFLSDGRRQIEGFHGENDIFGIEAGDERRLSAEAVSDCTVIAYCRPSLEGSAAANEALSRLFLSQIMHSMIRAQDHALLLGRRSAMEKVSAFLLECAKRSPDGRTISLAMARQDIADYLGLTTETVSRTLSQLERDGTIALPATRQICLKNPAALHDLDA